MSDEQTAQSRLEEGKDSESFGKPGWCDSAQVPSSPRLAGKARSSCPRGHSTKRLLLRALIRFWEVGLIPLPLS